MYLVLCNLETDEFNEQFRKSNQPQSQKNHPCEREGDWQTARDGQRRKQEVALWKSEMVYGQFGLSCGKICCSRCTIKPKTPSESV